VLTISGERKWERQEGEQAHRMECGYGSFSRSFTLPHQVNADKVQAKSENGMLRITIPKDEKARSRRVPIA
jgi:HSP20 family protein